MQIIERTAEIKTRFKTEQEYIQQYVDFLLAMSVIHEERVAEISHTLKQHGLKGLPRRKYDRIHEPFSRAELDALMKGIPEIRPGVVQAIRQRETKAANRPGFFTPRGQAIEHPKLLSEWTDYMLDHLSDEPTPEECEMLREDAFRGSREQHDRELPQDVIDNIIIDAIDYAVQIKAKSKIGQLNYILQQFDEICLVTRIAEPSAEINVLRQGFILLMTAFDAAMFDLVRVALQANFFGRIACFGHRKEKEKEKLSLEKIGRFSTFDELRNHVIEEQLKARYLKDLLFDLNRMEVKCIHECTDHKLIQLIELVLRRNLHVHNRGVVDEKYLERDQNGRPKYNLYKLSLGHVAQIDKPYWELANRLCNECVLGVAGWAET